MSIKPKTPAKYSVDETIVFIYDNEHYCRKIKSVKAYGNKWYYEVSFRAGTLMVPENKIKND